MFFTVIKKEAKQLMSDKGLLLIALLQPIIFIVVFGSAFQGGDIENLSTVVIDNDNTVYSSYVVSGITESNFFKVKDSSSYTLDEWMDKLHKSEIRALIVIPQGFGEKIDSAETAEIELYLDSSDYMTYKTLLAAQADISKNSLRNITEDIITELEKEKDKGITKIDEVKAIFDEIREEAEIVEEDLDESKNSNVDIESIRDSIDFIKSSLDNQTASLQLTVNSLDQIIKLVSNISTPEQQKVAMAVTQLSIMRSSFNQSISQLNAAKSSLNSVEIPDSLDSDLSTRIDNRLRNIRDLFEEADEMSQDINLDFNKLQKNFLSEPLRINESGTFGDIEYFDYLGAGVLSLIVFFVGLMIAAVNIIGEKESNTLYRLSTTPVSGFGIFLGKFTLFVIFGFIEMIYTLGLAVFIYNLRIDGSIFAVIVILSLLVCSAIAIGLLVSSKVKTMQQGLVIVPLLVIPFFLISQAFFPKDLFPEYMNYVSYLSPMTFSNHALRIIMIKGFSIREVMPDIYALICFIVIPLVLFVWSYRRIKY